MSKLSLFGGVRRIEEQIDELLDKVVEAALTMEKHGRRAIERGERASEEEAHVLKDLKTRGSQLRREIETGLYTQMLIPDLRGDVAQLIEEMHDLLEGFHRIALKASIEQPDLPREFNADYGELVTNLLRCVEAVVMAARAFFRDITAVRDQVHKVSFYESECDAIAFRLKRAIFGSDLGLDRKMQLCAFVDAIDHLADESESIADSLSIYSIKRSEE